MRRKREAVLTFEFNNDHLPKTVRQYREQYKGRARFRPRFLLSASLGKGNILAFPPGMSVLLTIDQ